MAKTPSVSPLFKKILGFFVSLIVLSLILSSFSLPESRAKAVTLGFVVEQIKAGKVKVVDINGDRLEVTLKDGTKLISRKEPTVDWTTAATNLGVKPEQLIAVTGTVRDNTTAAFWLNTLLPILVPILFVGGFIWLTYRQVQGQNTRALSFGQVPTKEPETAKKKRITFRDVAGAAEAKEELQEIVEFLKNPKRFTDLGARIPKGALLVGPPGTGKTLLAKAVAGEADVPFFNISGSEFVEMFVGVGASRVRDLFRRAKKTAPSIVFIDEIDAVGRQRGAGLGGGHDEREQTLNQILVEMDGFDTDTHVIVVAATNRPDTLDPALLRPGRFDRRITIDLPDINEREAILKVHAQQKPLGPDVNLRRLGERTAGFSGADLENMLNEAAIIAARQHRTLITFLDCVNAMEKVLLGPERKSKVMSEEEKKITAYHEAGHAVVAHFLPHTDPVQKVSIIARGRAGGFTLKTPEQDRSYRRYREFMSELSVMLAGQLAEQLVFNEISTGAANDLQSATRLVRQLITRFGMSKLGPRTFGEREELIFLGREIHEQRDYSEKVAQEIDREIDRLLGQARLVAERILRDHRSDLDKVAGELLVKETIEREDFEKLLGPKPTPTKVATART
ncbi:MAG: ATP-dependent zinc metalloprotease FtsH [Candidatus Kerfeldbacteria bacterium]|nr:ATP-dependent zinc metalloprotease FtsH [Candidatus Kerfeldbacteria bacterium]